jgi:alpha-L-rhamnosidase
MEWFYSGLAGIRQQDGTAGYRQLVIAPVPVQGIEWVRASYQSIQGMIKSEWKTSGDGLTMLVEIPVNAEATVYIPQQYSNRIIRTNGMHPDKTPGVRVFEPGPKEASLVVGGGNYEIVIE